jgi:hypothetical protein
MKWIRDFMVRVMFLAIVVLISASAMAQNFERIGAMATGFPAAMAFRNGYIYVAASGMGMKVIDARDPHNPILAGTYSDVPSPAMGITFNGDYAVLGCKRHLLTIDISNPANPVFVDQFDYPYLTENAGGDVVVYNNHVLTSFSSAVDSTGWEIIDISDPADIYQDTFMYMPYCLPYNFCLVNNYFYYYTFGGCPNEMNLFVYDVIDPTHPVQTGNIGNLHASYTITVDNNIVYFMNRTGFQAIDVTNPSNPTIINDFDTGPETYIQYYGRFAFCADNNFIYRIGGDNKLRAFDMTEPSSPRLAGIVNSFGSSGVYARNDTIYMASIDSLWIYRVISRETGTISGEVKDATTLAPIPGVIVNLWPFGIIDTTDALGLYEYNGLYGFDYILSFSHPDYFPLADSGIPAVPNQIRDHDVILQHRPYKEVTVTSLVSPTWFVDDNSSTEIIARFSNRGTSAQSFSVGCEIYYLDSDIPLTSFTRYVDNLLPAESTDLDMSRTFDQAGDTLFRIVVYTMLTGDEIPANDTLIVLPHPASRGDAAFYFGNPDGSPIMAEVGKYVNIGLYYISKPGLTIRTVFAGLGANVSYIDSLLEGHGYGPTIYWDDFYFFGPYASDSGWIKECLTGGNDRGYTLAPSQYPVKIAEYVGRIVNDSSLMDSTIYCLRQDCPENTFGVEDIGYVMLEAAGYFSPIYLMSAYQICDYKLGDINNDNAVGGADVTYGVRYFKGYGPAPSDSCWNNRDSRWLYSAGDVNGNCDFKGSDISRLVAYFKSTAQIEYCPFTPPASLLRPKKTSVSPISR